MLYSLMMGNKVSKSFSSLDLERLVTMSPEQGFRQLEVSTFTLLVHSSSCGELQTFSYEIWRLSLFIFLDAMHLFAILTMLFKCNLMKESNVERQTPTLPQKCIKILSGCTVVQGFFMLTLSDILVQSKKGFSYPNFFQHIQIVFSLPN